MLFRTLLSSTLFALAASLPAPLAKRACGNGWTGFTYTSSGSAAGDLYATSTCTNLSAQATLTRIESGVRCVFYQYVPAYSMRMVDKNGCAK